MMFFIFLPIFTIVALEMKKANLRGSKSQISSKAAKAAGNKSDRSTPPHKGPTRQEGVEAGVIFKFIIPSF
jgi:hypothetical protein